MRALVEHNLQEGAWGVTSGLDYLPGNFAHTDEIIKVTSVAAPWRTHYPSHERITRESGFSSKAGEGETIKVGVESGMLAILSDSAPTKLFSPEGAHFVLIGGEPLDGQRHIWWNFVSSRKERIEQAKADWLARRMGDIPGETEWIPLPV